MNCKPGDLAVVVRSRLENLGRLVEVVEWLGRVDGWTGDDQWAVKCDRPFISKYGVPNYIMRDSQLRPIRDPGEDARDETLSWLPVPAARTEPVTNGNDPDLTSWFPGL